MTVLALKVSRAANGVSELHGRVSRHMWQSLYPDKPVEQVPIGHITNGIYLLGWMKGPVRRFWRQEIDGQRRSRRTRDFVEQLGCADQCAGVSGRRWRIRSSSPTRKSGRLRYNLRRELIEFCRRRLLIQGQRLMHGDYIVVRFAAESRTR